MELERPEDEPLPGDWKRMPEYVISVISVTWVIGVQVMYQMLNERGTWEGRSQYMCILCSKCRVTKCRFDS